MKEPLTTYRNALPLQGIALAAIIAFATAGASCAPLLPPDSRTNLELAITVPMSDAPATPSARFLVPSLSELRISVTSRDPDRPYDALVSAPLSAGPDGAITVRATFERVPLGAPLLLGMDGMSGGSIVSTASIELVPAAGAGPVAVAMRPTGLFVPDAAFAAPSQSSVSLIGVDVGECKAVRIQVEPDWAGTEFALDFEYQIAHGTGIRVRFQDGSRVPFSFPDYRSRISFVPRVPGTYFVLLYNPTAFYVETGDVTCTLVPDFTPLPPSIAKRVGDPQFSIALPDVDGRSWSYSSTSASVATVDGAGLVTVNGAGSTTLYAFLSASGPYSGAETSSSLTVSP